MSSFKPSPLCTPRTPFLAMSLFALAAVSATACQPEGSTAEPAAASGSNAQLGAPAPSLAYTATDGAPAPTMEQFKGKVVIVDFWASWCAPCKDELPELEAMYNTYKDRGLEIIGVSVDEDLDSMNGFLEINPLSFMVVHDAKQEIVERWGAPKMPTSYIIDQNGNIAHIQAGFEPSDAEMMAQKVESLLEASGTTE